MTAAVAADGHRACVTCIFMNARHGAVAHRPRPELRLATRPCSQINLGRLVIDTRANVLRELILPADTQRIYSA